MKGVGRRVGLAVILALIASCAPTALPRSSGGAPSGTAAPVRTNDVITLREGGRQSYLAVRKVATGELVRELPDGLFLGDGRTILALGAEGASTTLRTIDRRTGATIASRALAGTLWTLRGGNGPTGASANATIAVLPGSSYAFADADGTWAARSTFAVVEASLASEPRVVELQGRFAPFDVSPDGRSLYLTQAAPVQLPTASQLRVYDLPSGAFADVAGDALPDPNASYRRAPVRVGSSSFALFAGSRVVVVRLDLDARTARTLRLPADQAVASEKVLLWSLVASLDGRTLYAINTAMGVIDEIDASTMQLRRTRTLARTTGTGFVARLLDAVHPVADAKRGVSVGAVLSSDGTSVYAIGETGIWVIDAATLGSRVLAKDGMYLSLALSPDGARIYALGFDDGVVRVVSARDGTMLGSMPRLAYPSDIVAVDSGD